MVALNQETVAKAPLEATLELIAAQLEKYPHGRDMTGRYAMEATGVAKAMSASTLIVIQRNLTLLSNSGDTCSDSCVDIQPRARIPDKDAPCCMNCDAKFTLFRRRQ